MSIETLKHRLLGGLKIGGGAIWTIIVTKYKHGSICNLTKMCILNYWYFAKIWLTCLLKLYRKLTLNGISSTNHIRQFIKKAGLFSFSVCPWTC